MFVSWLDSLLHHSIQCMSTATEYLHPIDTTSRQIIWKIVSGKEAPATETWTRHIRLQTLERDTVWIVGRIGIRVEKDVAKSKSWANNAVISATTTNWISRYEGKWWQCLLGILNAINRSGCDRICASYYDIPRLPGNAGSR